MAIMQEKQQNFLFEIECGAQNLQDKLAFNLCPAEFCTPQSARCVVLDPSKCAPHSFEAKQHVPSFLIET